MIQSEHLYTSSTLVQVELVPSLFSSLDLQQAMKHQSLEGTASSSPTGGAIVWMLKFFKAMC